MSPQGDYPSSASAASASSHHSYSYVKRNDTEPTSTAPASHKSNEVSAGAVAGVAVGALSVGAFFAFLGAWLLMKKGRRSGGGSHRHSRRGKSGHEDYGSQAGARPEVKLEENLLERADDSEIRKSMQDLNEVIDLHCENYFHLKSVDVRQGGVEQSLVEIGYNFLNTSGPSAAEIVPLLQNPQIRFSTVRLLLSLVILGHVDWKTRSQVSLLPPHVAAFLEKVPPVERQPGSQEIFDRALNKWRHLSSFLLEPIRSNREAPKANEKELRSAIDKNVRLINAVLRPFIKPGAENERSQEKNLRAIIFEGAQLGFLLFSQPSIWVRSWNSSRGQDEKLGSSHASTYKQNITLVVFPALGELIERHGTQRLRLVTETVEVRV